MTHKPLPLPKKPRPTAAEMRIKEFVRAMARAVTNRQMEKTLTAFEAEFGGAENLATAFHDTYESAKPGSPIRARMLFCIVKILEAGHDEEANDPWRQDFSMFTDEELEAYMRATITRIVQQMSDSGQLGSLCRDTK